MELQVIENKIFDFVTGPRFDISLTKYIQHLIDFWLELCHINFFFMMIFKDKHVGISCYKHVDYLFQIIVLWGSNRMGLTLCCRYLFRVISALSKAWSIFLWIWSFCRFLILFWVWPILRTPFFRFCNLLFHFVYQALSFFNLFCRFICCCDRSRVHFIINKLFE